MNRAGGRFPPRGGGGGARGRTQSRPPWRPNGPDRRGPPKRDGFGNRPKPTMTCNNCGIVGHPWKSCYKYPDQAPGSTVCPKCTGRHTGACKMGAQGAQAGGGQRRDQRPSRDNVAKP